MTGPSMEPTLRQEEYFTATAPAAPLSRGMLVIFRYEDEDGVFHVLRRLAALPGDTIGMQDGRVIVNGWSQPWPFRIVEPAASRSELARTTDLYTWGPIAVPPDSVFLLAETRDIIGWPDSRFLGPVAISAIEARAQHIVWSRERGRLLRALR
jgi:signal peptidase I